MKKVKDKFTIEVDKEVLYYLYAHAILLESPLFGKSFNEVLRSLLELDKVAGKAKKRKPMSREETARIIESVNVERMKAKATVSANTPKAIVATGSKIVSTKATKVLKRRQP